MQRQPVRPGTNQHDVLALVHRHLGNRGVPGFLHRLHQELVRLPPRFFRQRIVRNVKVERVDLLHMHELDNVHAPLRRRRDGFQLLRSHHHEGVLGFRIALDDFRALHRSLAVRAVKLLADPRSAHVVQHMKTHVLAPRGREKPDRHGDQAKREIAFPDGLGHWRVPLGYLQNNARPTASGAL